MVFSLSSYRGGSTPARRAAPFLARSLAITPNEAARHGLALNRDGNRRSAFELLSYPDVEWPTLLAIWPELSAIDPRIAVHLEIDAVRCQQPGILPATAAFIGTINADLADFAHKLLLSQMDIAGSVFASKATQMRTVTVAIDAMNFRKPVFVGDLVSVHAHLVRVGRTSITVHLDAWVIRRDEMKPILVTDGNFTYVAIDEHGHPQPIQRNEPLTA